ncbi:MAG: hypothetical protein NVSMB32_09000 [Actinomycetota bacterium]
MGLHPVEHLPRVEAARGGYDVMVYAIGNSEFHTGALGFARQRPGIVLAHDVALPQLYAFAAHHGVLDQDFGALFHAMYPDAGVEPPDPLLVNPAELNALPQAMARELIAASQVFLTTSEFAADLARREAAPGHAAAIGVLAHACRVVPARIEGPTGLQGQPGTQASQGALELVTSFGVVNATKDGSRLLEAFALVVASRPGARLAFVGQASPPELEALWAQATSLGIGSAVEATGAVDAQSWDAWLARAGIAVQLRRRTHGEYSGAIAECLAFGVPTIVASLGAAGELPPDVAVGVAPDIAPEDLAQEIIALLDDAPRRAALAAGGRAYAVARSFPAVAQELYGWITRLGSPGGRSRRRILLPSRDGR